MGLNKGLLDTKNGRPLGLNWLDTLADTINPIRKPVLLSDLKIRNKDEQIVAFVPNYTQEGYLDKIAPKWREGDYKMRGLQEIILKPRQLGFSTLIMALFFLDAINNNNVECMVMAHDSDATENLFQMAHRFYVNLPADKQPKLNRASLRELSFSARNSRMRVMTAGTKEAGRSFTFSKIHCSEVAFWPDPTIATGLLQALPIDGCIFFETTANGEGNFYHEEWQKAVLGASSMTPRFFPWFDHKEYRLPADRNMILDVDETKLVQRFGVTREQLAWRRWKMAQPGMGVKFDQEYPDTAESAFLLSGKRFFGEFRDIGQRDAHVVTPFDIPDNWRPFASVDWGYGDAFSWHLHYATDWNPVNVVTVSELYERSLTNREQVEKIKSRLAYWGIKPHEIEHICDPSMWGKKGRHTDGIGRSDIEDYWDGGLYCIPGNNHRVHGWSNMRTYLYEKGMENRTGAVDGWSEVPAYRVFTTCPNLIREFKAAVVNDKKPDDMAEIINGKGVDDHALADLRYGLNSRQRPSMSVEKRETAAKRRRLAVMMGETGPVATL